MAENDAHEGAAQLFAAARAFACNHVDQDKLDAAIARQYEKNRIEAEQYRNDVAAIATRNDEPPVAIISDSLGLPRTTAMDTPRKGAEHIYANLLSEALNGRRVDAICQRFFTTSDAVSLLEREPELGCDMDVVIHLGLNDTARRMFLERQRVSLSFIPKHVRERIVGFAQKWRLLILRHLPPLYYTPPEVFSGNLEFIARTLKARNARRIIFTTIIIPPLKFWRGTPDMEAYFTKYNMMIMSSAIQNGVTCLDLDRHIWASLHQNPLDSDGMHLGPQGHKLFAAELAKILK